MIYATCPSCGTFLGYFQHNFLKKKEQICNSDKTDEQIHRELTKELMKLPIRRYCCRMRLQTCINLVDEIIPVPDE